MPVPFGLDELMWDDLVDATIEVLHTVGRSRETITYGDLARRLHERVPEVQLDPHYGAMPHLLEEVNVAVARRDPGAPMISALVIGAETNEPGGGFYKAAERLGHVVSDRVTFWLGQVQAAHQWAGAR